MTDAGPAPWEAGDDDQRWGGYFIPGTDTLRNRLGITDAEELHQAEHVITEARAARLANDPTWAPVNYGVEGFAQVHRALFGRVYPWAGQLRTVHMSKGDTTFVSTETIAALLEGVDEFVHDIDRLRAVPDEHFPAAIASIWMAMNGAHPFREGNGRTTRIMLSALAAESGRDLAWDLVPKSINNIVSHVATDQMEPAPMAGVIAAITYRHGEAPPAEFFRPARAFGTESDHAALVGALFAVLNEHDPHAAFQRGAAPTAYTGDALETGNPELTGALDRARVLAARAEVGDLTDGEGIEAEYLAAYATTGTGEVAAEARDLAAEVDEASAHAHAQEYGYGEDTAMGRAIRDDEPAPDDSHLDEEGPQLR